MRGCLECRGDRQPTKRPGIHNSSNPVAVCPVKRGADWRCISRRGASGFYLAPPLYTQHKPLTQNKYYRGFLLILILIPLVYLYYLTHLFTRTLIYVLHSQTFLQLNSFDLHSVRLLLVILQSTIYLFTAVVSITLRQSEFSFEL